jgi:hypothetical protein
MSALAKKEVFFFEKKEAKNFCACAFTPRRVPRPACAEPTRQKFFGSFFQKRTASFLFFS